MQVASHGPLSRAYTAPNGIHAKVHGSGPSPLIESQNHTGSSYSMKSQPSSRSSDTTQGTAHSTLFPAPPVPTMPSSDGGASNGGLPVKGGPVEPSANIMNMVGDKNESLFQICIFLKQRLVGVPGFQEILEEMEQEVEEDIDPVSLLWRLFRKGEPLVFLYNVLKPDAPIAAKYASITNETKRGKAATFKFLQACIQELQFPVEECFIIYDLYGDDTTGFVKVAKMVSRVLDMMVLDRIIEDLRPGGSSGGAAGGKLSRRHHIVNELVNTERTYVQHLELLQAFKQQCEKRGVVPGDVIHQIFLNLNTLLDFQRRFLIRVEQINAMPEDNQDWGELFVLYADAFTLYEPYISNQKMCEETVVREFDHLAQAGGSIEMVQMVESPRTLYSFLMKPFQRLTKYPMLLNELYKHGDFDEQRKANLLRGRECAESILNKTNAAIDREDKLEAVHELKNRVEDWKGHRVEGFGDLLLFGTFTVVKSDTVPSSKDMEREYHVYFFESILLCCKDINPNKPKNKMSTKPLVDKKGKPKLQLKGRIFMQNVTDVLKASKAGTYTCQIFWKGDPGIENFVIRFTTEEMMQKWYNQLLEQKKQWTDTVQRSSTGSRPSGPSSTEFTYLQQQTAGLENPYREDDEDDEADTVVSPAFNSLPGSYPISTTPGEFGGSSRNASSSSLRSRSTTGESAPPPTGRMPPPRLPNGSLNQPALSLRTQHLQSSFAQSPADRAMMDSYFSPTAESPISSSRTSSSSGMYPFPRQALPPNGYYEEGHGRYTAPVMSRTASRDPSGGSGYPSTARGIVPRPSYPTPSGQTLHSAQQIPTSRNRSASSPHINGMQRQMMAGPAPPMPDLPSQYPPPLHPSTSFVHPNRSQSNSPNLSMAPRPAQSPGAQRERSHTRPRQDSPHYGYDGTAVGPGPRYDPRGPPPTSGRMTPVPGGSFPRDAAISPPLPSSTPLPAPDAGVPQPTQLKVKVHATAAGQVLTLVVPLNITYQSLKDRIDAKLQRSTNCSLSANGTKEQVKLKYLDEDDYVSIQSDEDVQMAFESWREQRGADVGAGGVQGMGEIELFCQ